MVLQIARIRGATRTLGVKQGFIGLPIRDGIVKDDETGILYPAMESAWTIELPDIDKLINGEPLIVQLWGRQHPPILIKVGDDFVLPEDHPDANVGLLGLTKMRKSPNE